MHRFSPLLFGKVFSEITNEEANSKGNIEKYVQFVLAHIPLLSTSHGEPKPFMWGRHLKGELANYMTSILFERSKNKEKFQGKST